MTLRFSDELAYASRELTRIRQDISHADSVSLATAQTERERSGVMRAYAYVWLAALLERVVRDALRDSIRELNLQSVPANGTRASLFSLLCDPEFAAVSDRNRQSGWPMRVSLLEKVNSAAPVTFSEEIVPLDGRTLRGEHFDTLWLVFGLPGPSLPGPLHRIALKDLADGRNEVAHGHSEPAQFGRRKASSDLMKLALRIDDVITHLLGALDQYLTRKLYAR